MSVVRIASKSASRSDTLFAIQRIYGSAFYARPFIQEGTKAEFLQVMEELGYEVNETAVKSLFKTFKTKLARELEKNRVTDNATYVFKTENPKRRVTLPSGIIAIGNQAKKIVYRKGSYISRVFYRMSPDRQGEFVIFMGSGSSDVKSVQEGETLSGGRFKRFVSYSTSVDQALPNRRPYTVQKTRRVFMPYKTGAKWVTLKEGTVVNPPQDRPVNSLQIWNETVALFRNKIISEKGL